mgnify:CR=1 FL=1
MSGNWRKILSWKQPFSICSRVEVTQKIWILDLVIYDGEQGTIVDKAPDGVIVKFDNYGVPSDWVMDKLQGIEDPRDDGFWVMLEDLIAI